jgi:4-hydroxy-2-oxoheptanedioate aldolase
LNYGIARIPKKEEKMNTLENKMVDVLKDLRDNYNVIGVKAEFEAEGTRLEEVLRLKDIVMNANLGLTIKIGGCEAVRDMYECRVIGVERIVAPMIESPFALKKYLDATKLAFPADERKKILFAANIETITACKLFDEILNSPGLDYLGGIVVGRGDLACSMGLTRDDINTDIVYSQSEIVLQKAKDKGFETVIGGGVSGDSIPFFKKLPKGILDNFETRKVIFNVRNGVFDNTKEGILKAVGFELLWLKNKRDYYSIIANEDVARIQNLEKRYRASIETVGGKVE